MQTSAGALGSPKISDQKLIELSQHLQGESIFQIQHPPRPSQSRKGVCAGPSYLFLESLEPDALADQSQLLLIEVAAAAHAQLFPDGPDLVLRGVKEGAAGLLGPKDFRTPDWQLA